MGLFLDSILSHLSMYLFLHSHYTLTYSDNLQHVLITSRTLHFTHIYIIVLILPNTCHFYFFNMLFL